MNRRTTHIDIFRIDIATGRTVLGVQRLSVVAARDEDQVDVLVRVDRGIDQT